MRLAPLLLIVSAPLLACAASAGERASIPNDLPLPGYWEMTTKVESIIHDTKTERRCYGPNDVPRLVQPCNHHYNCEYSTQDARNGHLTLKGAWVAKKGGQVVQVQGTGLYTRDDLKAEAQMHTSFLGIPLSGTGHITAHRISGTCPADAKKG